MTTNDWASDAPVSLPESVQVDGMSVPMFGFVFTEQGLFHDLSEADHEVVSRPTFAPPPAPSEVEWGDGR